jgi:chorismate-pyruvate lyase
MSTQPNLTNPDTRGLFGLFPQAEYLAYAELVSDEQVPEPYHSLLAHEHHMTVTVEQHHGSPVDVRVLQEYRGQNAYARKILLELQSDRRVVMFGLVRIHLRFCADDVRAEILSGQIPLGRVLINHDILRRIEPTAFVRVVPGPGLMTWFGLPRPRPTYGRLATIHCDNYPAVELLEIVAPEP